MDIQATPLLTDLYQLNMVQAYLDLGETETAVFELFVRNLPPRRSFLLAAGLEQALDFLEGMHFCDEEIDWLAGTGRFNSRCLEYLADFRFTGEVHAMPEGTAFFADEPILRVTAPMPQAQLVETRLINILHFQTVVASKAARMVLAAPGKNLIDFGLRRAHGSEAGLLAARASYVAGFTGTATVLADKLYGIPSSGTMAHSFIEAFEDESAAFEMFARSCPKNLILLLDTYDTERAARKVLHLAPKLAATGIRICGVRLDSGDLVQLSKKVRHILDGGGLTDVMIFASGGLDEDSLAEMMQAGAPIGGFGIGTSLTTSSDAPALDCAYKLQEYAGLVRRKLSPGKETWPGRKQVWRRYGSDKRMLRDVVSCENDAQVGSPLIIQVMREGRRIAPDPTLAEIRALAAKELQRLPKQLRKINALATYHVEIADALRNLASEFDRRKANNEARSE